MNQLTEEEQTAKREPGKSFKSNTEKKLHGELSYTSESSHPPKNQTHHLRNNAGVYSCLRRKAGEPLDTINIQTSLR